MASTSGLGTSPTAVTTAAPPITAAIFQQDYFQARRRVFSFMPSFCFRDRDGSVLAFLRKKVFSWKDDIRVFSDRTQTFELLRIKGRQIIDFGASFDVTDSINHQKVGTLKRRGWKSLLRAEWDILDASDQEIGKIQEDSAFLAVVRRTLGHFVPQGYTFKVADQVLGSVTQNWNFLAPTISVDFTNDKGKMLDRRLIVAAVVLLMSVERDQESDT